MMTLTTSDLSFHHVVASRLDGHTAVGGRGRHQYRRRDRPGASGDTIMRAAVSIVWLSIAAGVSTGLPHTRDATTSSINITADRLLSSLTDGLSNSSRHAWGVSVKIPKQLSGLSEDEVASFDVPNFLYLQEEESLLAAFHSGIGGQEGSFAIYLAETTSYTPGIVPQNNDWRVLSKLTSRGSMGNINLQRDGSIYFAYEMAGRLGSTIAIRLYRNVSEFKANSYWVREVQLERFLECVGPVVNVGTPTISSVLPSGNIALRFHYYTGKDGLDHPGKGSVTFPNSGNGVVSTSFEWQGKADYIQLRALLDEDVVGKVGQRAVLSRKEEGDKYLLLEGQMANNREGNIGWLSWRPILYSLQTQEVRVLTLHLPSHVETFANPQVADAGNGFFVLSFFVPSQAFDSSVVLEYQGYDPSRCPTCAKDALQVAGEPARAGSLIVFFPSSYIFPVKLSNESINILPYRA